MRLYPFSDEDMEYDKNSHMYILTPYYCVNTLLFPDDLGLKMYDMQKKSSAVKAYLKRVSRTLYNFIYQHTMQTPIVEWEIAKLPQIREPFKEALSEQLLYMRNNGDLQMYSGVDYKRGTMLDVPNYKAISPVAIQILNSCGLLYTGERCCPCHFRYREDY